ncbi:hypothetical protein [Wenjunlia tyrosinilytica]|uniref:hypothetical protein n=1 Tax=Wenjunlia tyrosinilytica TaxID=1544741 RepID=UPI00166896E7|nr:hypothetical protein [Wenjunlia tyrosinilytica]
MLPSRGSGRTVKAMLHAPRCASRLTGSNEVGRLLFKDAADYVVSNSMEPGGNAPSWSSPMPTPMLRSTAR